MLMWELEIQLCLFLYLTGVHYRGELQHGGDVSQQKIKRWPIRTWEIGGVSLSDLLYDHQKSNLRERPFPTKPNEIVSIDFRADLKKSIKGNIHILTIVDNFSKLIKVYALQGRTAITVSRFVYNSCLVYGIPEKICLDQDPAFEANAFPQLMKQLGINKFKTTSYNPNSNGVCE